MMSFQIPVGVAQPGIDQSAVFLDEPFDAGLLPGL